MLDFTKNFNHIRKIFQREGLFLGIGELVCSAVDSIRSTLLFKVQRVKLMSISGSGVRLHAGARVYNHEQINISKMKLGVGAPPGEGLKDGFPTLDFAAGADDEVFFSFKTPSRYDTSTNMSLHIIFFVDTAPAAAAGVCWALEWKATAMGETIDFTAGTATLPTVHPVTVGTPANDALRLDCEMLEGGAGAIAADDLIQCRLYRDVSDAGDTFAGDARLINAHVHYISNKLGESI